MYTSGSFLICSKNGLQLKKKLLQFYQSVLKFDLYLRGADYVLHCNHKPLEPFLSKGMKMPKLG